MDAPTLTRPDSALANPALTVSLAFVAGFVDACTFLAFSGFFVAQVTGSLVVAGSELVASNSLFALKVVAIPVFVLAGVVTASIARWWACKTRQALVVALCLEAVLLSGLTVSGVAGSGALAVAPALFGLAAMGVQSAAVHLLVPGHASTNVMTTNITQLSIDLTDSVLGRRLAPGLVATATVIVGFLAGVTAGGLAFRAMGLSCLAIAVAIILAVALVEARLVRTGDNLA